MTTTPIVDAARAEMKRGSQIGQPQPKLNLGPLITFIHDLLEEGYTREDIAAMTEKNWRSIYKQLNRGVATIWWIDEVCIALGVLPENLFGPEFLTVEP